MRGKIFVLLMILFSGVVQAGFLDNAAHLEDKIHVFAQDDNTVIYFGERISNAERIMYNYLKDNDQRVKDFEIVNEIGNQTTFLVGGPRQNEFTSQLLSREENKIEEENLEFGTLIFITTKEGQKFMIFSDRLGFENIARNPSRSPLAKFIPLEYIPLVATGIGFSLLWLWKFIMYFVNRVIRSFSANKLMKYVTKKEFRHEYKGHKVRGIRLKYREWLSIFFAAIIFALAFSFSYFFDGDGLIEFIMANVIVNIIIYSIRHLTRLFMDRVHELHTEYVFWWPGAIITVLTGWLGNTFSLAGYTISDPKRESKKEGRITFHINLFLFIVGILFFVWNLLTPNSLIQMSMMLALAIVALQMLPFDPFGGRKIYKWKKSGYYLLSIPVLLTYIMVNFLL